MILKNEQLSVTISSLGAEVKSIYFNETEYLWEGDPLYWKRSSPVLFPIVGRLLDDEYYHDGKTYQMSQHGFARDYEFTVVESNETSAMFLLRENEETLVQYPFAFELYIGYKLDGNSLVVTWRVVNTNLKKMYFQIGAHPAFNFLNHSIVEINKTTNSYQLNGTPYVHDVVLDCQVDSINIDNSTFIGDALVFDNIDSLKLRDLSKFVEIISKDFPFFGIWSKVTNGENAPFICLEPWYGIADCTFHDKELSNKKGINILHPYEEFNTSYIIKVGI